MEKRPFISIIVPVYNVEAYLPQCLDSLIGQTYSNIEIILVDDGSADRSGAICDAYAEKDNRIKIIHQMNSGVSQARNCGLQNAIGNYILFVDGDDWTDINTCSVALNAQIEHDADVVMWTYLREYDGHTAKKDIFGSDKVFEKDAAKGLQRRFIGLLGEELAHPENADAISPVWGKLYRREMIEGIRFADLSEIGSCEDGLYNLAVFGRVEKAVYLDRPLYHYRKTNSASLTSVYNAKLFPRWQHLFDLMAAYIAENDLPEDYTEALNNRIALSLIGLGLNVAAAELPFRQKVAEISKILHTKRYSEAYKQLEYQYFPIHWKAFFICARLKWSLAVLLLCHAMDKLRKSV